MDETPPQLVVFHLADECRAGAKARYADDRVRGGTSRTLDRRAHCCVDRLRPHFIDQRHRALVHALRDQEVIFGAGDHIDNGVADAEHVIAESSHVLSS